jgi:hypothetical protein
MSMTRKLYYKKIHLQDISLKELKELHSLAHKGYLATVLHLPKQQAKTKEGVFEELVYLLEVIDSSEMMHVADIRLQQFYDNLLKNCPDSFFDEIVELVQKKEARSKKQFNTKKVAYWQRDTYRMYNKTKQRYSCFGHKENTIAATLDVLLKKGGYVEELAEKAMCSSARVKSHYTHLRRDLRVAGFQKKEAGQVFLKILQEEL